MKHTPESVADLPWSAACERNKQPILERIKPALNGRDAVLEIGSGTGQHAVHFAREMPAINWQPTDRAEWLPGLRARVTAEGSDNLLLPLELDVRSIQWPVRQADAIYSANTLHIMSWNDVQHFFAGVGRTLASSGVLAVYGPFRYGGAFTSASNAAFDEDLRARDPASGIRDIEAVNALASAQGLTLTADHRMPANNQLLVWLRA